jgi:hypothetical protein
LQRSTTRSEEEEEEKKKDRFGLPIVDAIAIVVESSRGSLMEI